MKIKMRVSIASSTFSYQPGEVIDLADEKLARTWLQVGHAEKVPANTPLSNRDINLCDLDADEVLHRHCSHCNRRASFVLKNKPYCPQHFRAEQELG